MMELDSASGIQAAFVAMLIYRGRVQAEEWFTRLAVAGGLGCVIDEFTLSAVLGQQGLPSAVRGEYGLSMDPAYDQAYAEGFLSFGRFKNGTGPQDSVWGMMYIKPCRCRGLALLDGLKDTPRMTVPHRETYLGQAVTICRPSLFHWLNLHSLPTLYTS